MKAISLFTLCLFLCMVGCTDLKDESYDTIIAEQFTPAEDDIGSLIASAYVPWRNLFNKWQSYFWAQEICTDELIIPKRPWGWVDDGGYRRFHYHSWTSEDAIVSTCWQRAYNGITTCNRVIYQIENDLIPTGTFKESALAELKVLRASYYWVLCDMYGNVPIVTSFDVPADFLPTQNTRQEVFDFIVTEVTENLAQLSPKNDQSTYGRMNQWVAHTLLAKLYLNAEVYTGTSRWEECIAQCDAVINANVYSLEANQKNIFVTNNEGSKEIIWAFVYDDKYLVQYWDDWNAFDHHMQSLPQEMQATYNLQNSPWGGICAIPQFISTFDTLDDRFKENWIRGPQFSANGDQLIVQNGAQKGQPLNLVNVLPAVDTSEANHGLRLGKFEIADGSGAILKNDFPFFRYADILMMKAECLLRTGRADEAAALVTTVLERSFRTHPEKAAVTGAELMGGSTYDYGRRDVHGTSQEGGASVPYGRLLDELGYEFFEEAHRRQDLIRFGVFTEKSWLSHEPNGDYRTLYPLPQIEINKNSNLKQNPGY
ncbi:Starch-binding associating with outer membrane [Catalinimonas alkaloidigena]|uniref:Starch-binding associating with outer membrane n=1 Tax=Catalinimonas alkaloidigena TaxID=1075417 RepID=A0A1G9HKC6_9BACT|nr:RagB/SusD family nutrient uptake outer membrane protein [Catalinimonas alkaloidigena]SDL13216.1 Starch-binding associating with outer membrane [Catalinimonas alkaloidigena]